MCDVSDTHWTLRTSIAALKPPFEPASPHHATIMEPIPEALCCDVWGPPPPSELSSSLARVDELSAATKPMRNLYLNKFIIFPFKNFIQGYSALRQDMTPYRTNKAQQAKLSSLVHCIFK